MQRRNSSHAYFAPERFAHRVADAVIAELAFNPDYFLGRADIEILSSLVHEMAHCWQAHYGMPSRAGYHNREWAAKMEALGLMPSDTGKPGGKRTGQRMAHYLISGGRFAQAAEGAAGDRVPSALAVATAPKCANRPPAGAITA